MRWLGMVALIASCGGGGSKQSVEAPPPAVDSPAAPGAPAETAAAPAPDAGPPPLPAVEGVPPLTKQAVERPRSAEAKKLNTRALGAHRAGYLDEAIATYKQAVNADAGYLLARYNLASALVTAGEPGKAMYLLEQFRDVGCPACIERLVRAREDKEWAPLWGDARFDAITRVEIDSAHVGVAAFHVAFAPSKKRVVATPTIWVDRVPGFATLPPLELVLRGTAGEESRQPVDPGRLEGYRLDAKPVAIPGPGSYALELEAGGAVLAADTFAVAEKRCYGGRRVLEVLDSPEPQLVSELSEEEEDYYFAAEEGEDVEIPPYALEWSVPGFLDGRVYAVIWTRGKKVVHKELISIDGTSTMESLTKKTDEQCPLRLMNFQLEVPEDVVTRPGRWTVGLYSEHGASYLLTFQTARRQPLSGTRIHVKTVRTLPRVAVAELASAGTMAAEWEQEEPYPYGKQVLRGMARSRALFKKVSRFVAIVKAKKRGPATLAGEIRALAKRHGGPWTDEELPAQREWLVTARPLASAATTRLKESCLANVCPDYPALSPDGKLLVARYETIITTDENGCDGLSYDVVHTFGSTGGASVDMTEFKVVTCDLQDAAALLDGHKLAVKQDADSGDAVIRVLDAADKEVAKAEHAGSGFELCAAPGVRAVVYVGYDSATHCNETPAPSYEVLRY